LKDDLPPIELTVSIRRKICRFMWFFSVGRGGYTMIPRLKPSDRICLKFGYMDCNRIGRRHMIL